MSEFKTGREIVAEVLASAGLPCSEVFQKAAMGSTREEIEENVKALSHWGGQLRTQEAQALEQRRAALRADHAAALKAGNVSKALALKSRLAALR